MEAGAQVWYSDPATNGDEVWILAVVTASDVNEICVAPVEGKGALVRSRCKDGSYNGVEFANSTATEGPDNLIALPHLNEPCMLNEIQCRFHLNQIYTFTGPVLIAINPFQNLPSLYTKVSYSYKLVI